jgi:two-component system, NtrC family, sensor kinase
MSGTVLVVDDSLTVRMNLMEVLDHAGLPASACGTVAEARHMLAQDTFSLVILDVLLPDGDGIELLQEIRAMPSASTTAVMLLSTEAEVRDRVRGMTTGADEYIGKPYDPAYIVGRARELVRRGTGGSQQAQEAILLIDDSITFREALKDALEQASYASWSPVAAKRACGSPPMRAQPRSWSMANSPASTAGPSSGASGSTARSGGRRACC